MLFDNPLEPPKNTVFRPGDDASQALLPKTLRLAKTSFVFGLIGLFVPAILLAIVLLSGKGIQRMNATTEIWSIIAIGIAVLCLAALALTLPGIIIGIIALVKIRRSAGMLKGKGLAISGIILCVMPIVLVGAMTLRDLLRDNHSLSYTVQDFDASTYTGSKGNLVMPYKGRSRINLVDAGLHISWVISSTNGTFLAPKGSFELSNYTLMAKDEHNADWELSLAGWARRITIINDESFRNYEVGLPITATIEVTRKLGRRVGFSLFLADKNNNYYTIKPRDPTFKVLSSSGEALWQDKLSRGKYAEYEYSGPIPTNVKGKVIIRPDFADQPFNITIKDSEWSAD